MLMTTVAIFLLDHYLIFCSFKINIIYIIVHQIVKLFNSNFILLDILQISIPVLYIQPSQSLNE